MAFSLEVVAFLNSTVKNELSVLVDPNLKMNCSRTDPQRERVMRDGDGGQHFEGQNVCEQNSNAATAHLRTKNYVVERTNASSVQFLEKNGGSNDTIMQVEFP